MQSYREHARVKGSPGARPRAKGLFRTLWPLFLFCLVAGYLLRAAWPVPAVPSQVAGFMLLLLAGAMGYAMVWGERRFSNFSKGARGEEEVARALSFLPASYRVFHGLSSSGQLLRTGRDYDHVVVGPTGVFLIETKNWNGRITIEDGEVLYNGEHPDRPAVEEVHAASRSLERDLAGVEGFEEVFPVLCFVSGVLQFDRGGARGVMICNLNTLLDIVQEQGDVRLSKRDVENIASALERQPGASANT